MTPLINKAVTFFPELAADYKWFDKSDIDNGVEFTHKLNEEAIRNPLPFDKCAIAGLDMSGQTYALLVSKEDGVLRIRGANTLAMYNNQRVQFDPIFRIDPNEIETEHGLTIFFEDEQFIENEQAKEITIISMVVLATFLRLLNDNRINTVYTPTPSKNHAKRLRQGKPPLFSWHTVTIEPPKPKSESLGGTHASPRLHEVRGHWVTRNGKRFWRKPHQRGDASRGIVFHDYKLVNTPHARGQS